MPHHENHGIYKGRLILKSPLLSLSLPILRTYKTMVTFSPIDHKDINQAAATISDTSQQVCSVRGRSYCLIHRRYFETSWCPDCGRAAISKFWNGRDDCIWIILLIWWIVLVVRRWKSTSLHTLMIISSYHIYKHKNPPHIANTTLTKKPKSTCHLFATYSLTFN